MRKDAEVNAESDKQKQELVEAQNGADQLTYAAEKALKEHGDKVSDESRKGVQDKIDALKTARTGSDTGLITQASDSLSSEMSKIGEAMSKAAPNSATDQTPPADTDNTEGK